MTSLLIVERGVLFRRALRKNLELHMSDLFIDEAESSSEALRKIDVNDYDLAFVDVHIGEKKGLELIKEIKGIKPGIFIAALADYDYPEYSESTIESGADFFHAKESLSMSTLTKLIKIIGLRKGSFASHVLNGVLPKKVLGAGCT